MAWPWQEQRWWRQALLRARWFGPKPYAAYRRPAARQRDKFRCEALGNSPGSVVELNGKTKGVTGRTSPSRDAMNGQKILAALCSVIQTPHARGMPTKAQNSAALASSPPNPMPNDPDGPDELALAVAACSFATSASLMCHLWSTGLIR